MVVVTARPQDDAGHDAAIGVMMVVMMVVILNQLDVGIR